MSVLCGQGVTTRRIRFVAADPIPPIRTFFDIVGAGAKANAKRQPVLQITSLVTNPAYLPQLPFLWLAGGPYERA